MQAIDVDVDEGRMNEGANESAAFPSFLASFLLHANAAQRPVLISTVATAQYSTTSIYTTAAAVHTHTHTHTHFTSLFGLTDRIVHHSTS